MNNRVIAIVNQKGGVGKTSCTLNIGAGLALKNKKVLYIDADAQGNLTVGLGIRNTDGENTIFEVLKGECSIEDAIIKTTNNASILPADIALAAADLELANEPGKDFLLHEAINLVENEYDYILIDCPPSLGMMTVNSLVAAKEVIIVMMPEFLSAQGVSQLTRTIDIVQRRINHDLKISGVILNMYNGRRKLHREASEEVAKMFKDRLYKTYIRNSVTIAESPGFGQDIFAYKSDSTGAKDFSDLIDEILKQEHNNE